MEITSAQVFCYLLVIQTLRETKPELLLHCDIFYSPVPEVKSSLLCTVFTFSLFFLLTIFKWIPRFIDVMSKSSLNKGNISFSCT